MLIPSRSAMDSPTDRANSATQASREREACCSLSSVSATNAERRTDCCVTPHFANEAQDAAPMPLPRFRIRTLMIAVGVVVVGCAVTVFGGLTGVQLAFGVVLGSPLIVIWLLMCLAVVRGDDLRSFEKIEAHARAKPGMVRRVKPSLVAPCCICLPAMLIGIPAAVWSVYETPMGWRERVG